MTHKLLNILLALSLVMFVGCGSDDDDADRSTIPQQEEDTGGGNGDNGDGDGSQALLRDFNTRLSPSLAVKGERCQGGETLEDPEAPAETCDRDEWLVTIDNDNTCTENGDICTEIFVYPFIAKLDRSETRTTDQYNFYRIDPESPIQQDEREVIQDVWVRADKETGETTVVRRN